MTDPTCAKDDCAREPFARGYCGTHYQWARRHGVIQKIEKPAVCTVEACGLPVQGWGYCKVHYSRWRKHGDPQADVPIRQRRTEGCAMKLCREQASGGELCQKHLDGIEMFQDPDPSKRRRGMPCTISGCGNASLFRGWCALHYSRWARHGDVFDDIPRQVFTGSPVCSERGCHKSRYSKGMCRPHYREHLRTGRLGLRPEPTPEEIEERGEREREYQRRFKKLEYQRDPERVRSRRRAWMQANPERVKLFWKKKQQIRRAAKKLPYTLDQLAAKVARWGWKCWMCGDPWECIDHVKPISKGGWDALCNLRPACNWCNSSKFNQWPFPTTTRPEEYFSRLAA